MSRRVLGIRTSTTEIRYALLEDDADGNMHFINKDGENKLQYPATEDDIASDLKWLKTELDRIFRQKPNIEQVMIKTSEYSGIENKSKRKSTYAEAVCILTAAEHNTPVSCKLYSQLRVSSGNVKQRAEELVGRTDKYWDSKIADAVMAAYSVR